MNECPAVEDHDEKVTVQLNGTLSAPSWWQAAWCFAMGLFAGYALGFVTTQGEHTRDALRELRAQKPKPIEGTLRLELVLPGVAFGPPSELRRDDPIFIPEGPEPDLAPPEGLELKELPEAIPLEPSPAKPTDRVT